MSDGAQVLAAIENVKLVDIGPTTMTKGSKKRASSGRRAGRSSLARAARRAAPRLASQGGPPQGCLGAARGWPGGLAEARLFGRRRVGRVPRAAGGDEVTVPKSPCSCNPDFLEGTSDLTNLTYLNEPSVLHNVRLRYDRDEIYTRAETCSARTPSRNSRSTLRRTPRHESAPRREHIFEVAQRATGTFSIRQRAERRHQWGVYQERRRTLSSC